MPKHHAYLQLVSEVSIEAAEKTVLSLALEEVTYISIDSFGINDVRGLTEKAFMMPVTADRQLLVILTKFITEEAQQALLKILEEPPRTTVFLFVVPSSLFLLPTLLSRFNKLANDTVKSDSKSLESFLALAIAERFTEISNRLEAKDSLWTAAMKSDLLDLLSNKSNLVKNENKAHLYWISCHLLTRGASNKQLLEELALSL